MKLLTTIVGVAAMVWMNAGFARDWKEELAGPLVTIVGNKMVFEELELCTASDKEAADPSSFQVRTRSEAPKGKFISRDYFVAITALLKVGVLDQLGDVECKALGSAIGTADVEITLVMAEEGMQVETANTRTGEKSRTTVKWEDMFAE